MPIHEGSNQTGRLLDELRSEGRVDSAGRFTKDPEAQERLAWRAAESVEGALEKNGFHAITLAVDPLLDQIDQLAKGERLESESHQQALRWSRRLGALAAKLERHRAHIGLLFPDPLTDGDEILGENDVLPQALFGLGLVGRSLCLHEYARPHTSGRWRLPDWLQITKARHPFDEGNAYVAQVLAILPNTGRETILRTPALWDVPAARERLAEDHLYPIVVDDRQSIDEMIAGGRYDMVDLQINERRFPNTHQERARRRLILELIAIQADHGPEYAIQACLARHATPASLPELLALGAQHRLKPPYSIVALGEKGSFRNYPRLFPFLVASRSHGPYRRLILVGREGKWKASETLFAAIHDLPKQ